MDWIEIKDGLEAASGLSRDALHIYLALLIQIVAALVFRRRLADLLPWFAVLAFAVANEIFDSHSDGPVEQWEVVAGAHDLWNSMVVPTVLLLLTRFAPGLAVRDLVVPATEAERPGAPRVQSKDRSR